MKTTKTELASMIVVLDVDEAQKAMRAGHSALASWLERKLNAAKITTLELNGDEVEMLNHMATDALELWEAKGFPAVTRTNATIQQCKELCEQYRWFATNLSKL